MELIPDLAALGFSEYEARIYLALLREHPATGYQLSTQSGVPRSMVYEALGRLSLRGAVLKSEEQRATLYRPIPPDMLLDRFAQEHTQRIQSLRHALRGVYTAREEDRLWTITSRPAVIGYCMRMIGEANAALSLVLCDRDLLELSSALQDACQRRLEINLLLTGDLEFEASASAKTGESACLLHCARHPPLESELQELTDMLVVAADGEKCLIASSDPASNIMSGTVTNNPNLVLIASQFVWMELFTQRIYSRLGDDLLARLDPHDRSIFESYTRDESGE